MLAARGLTFELLHTLFERFEPGASSLQHLRLHVELIARGEVESAETGAQNSAKVLFQILLNVSVCLGYFREQPPDNLIDTQLFHERSFLFQSALPPIDACARPA